MSTETKSKTGIFAILKNLFNSEPDIEDYDDVTLPPALEEALKARKGEEDKAAQPINAKTSSNAGLAPKIDPKTEEAMRKMHNQQVNRELEEDRER